MRLAASNIAWKPEEHISVYELLSAHGVRGLEIAPSLAFAGEPDAFVPSVSAVSAFRRALENHDLSVVSMQSLHFGIEDARLFGSPGQRERFEAGLVRAADLAGRLGVPNLVMGAPVNRRIPDGMGRSDAERLARQVFLRVGERCERTGARLALEPNASSYGTNFLTSLQETVDFVRSVDHPAVRLNLDMGCLLMNGELEAALEQASDLVAVVNHVHISAPNLAPAPRDPAEVEELATALLGHGYGGWFSIEMRATGENNLGGIRAAARSCAGMLRCADLRRS